MNTPTPTSPFALIHYSDGGHGTHIDYTDYVFFPKRKSERKKGKTWCTTMQIIPVWLGETQTH